MDKMFKVKIGAIVREVPEGALKWYIMAGWKVVNNGKTNKKKPTTSRSKI